MKLKIFCFLIVCLVNSLSAQSSIFDDTTIVFQNGFGKLLSREEAKILMSQGPVKMIQKTNGLTGEKIVVLLPVDSSETRRMVEETEKYIARFKGRLFKGGQFRDIKGASYDSRTFQGKVVVLNFWFTACKPCVEEIPDLNDLFSEYENKDVVFISFCNDSDSVINRFLTKHTFAYPIIPNGSDFAESMGIQIFPTHLIIDKSGVIQDAFVGGIQNINRMISPLIEKYCKK